MTSGGRRVRLVVRAFGWRGVTRRAWYVARLRSGWFRHALPCGPIAGATTPPLWSHRYDIDAIRSSYHGLALADQARSDVVTEADRVLIGELRFFGGHHREVGWPPIWTDPKGAQQSLPMVHWSLVGDDLGSADIKDVWESSRFAFTFVLVRAFVFTGDDRYAEQWWRAVEDWTESNPPNTGPNWRCGQETALRGIALCFGVSAFGNHTASTPQRHAIATALLAASLTRIRPTVGYALSQRNNHAISELAFLLALEPAINSKWVARLEEVLGDQWYPDGSYSQQSFVYQRLAAHALVWLLHARHDLPSSLIESIRGCLAATAEFFERCSDPVSGMLPNSGANDGSLLLDLARADRMDARPLLALLGQDVQSAAAAEPCIWFPPGQVGLPTGSAHAAHTSSYHTLRGPLSLLITRAGNARHRPADDDQQAIELFLEGARTVLDPGSFRYSAAPPWRQPFTSTAAHSMARPRGSSAGYTAGRFLREPMPPAAVVASNATAETDVLVTRRTEGGISLTRTIVRVVDRYGVVDSAEGGEFVVHWLMPGGTTGDPITGFRTATGHRCVVTGGSVEVRRRRDDDPTSGWWSPTYANLEAAFAFDVTVAAEAIALARFAPEGQEVLSVEDVIEALAGLSELQEVRSRLVGTRTEHHRNG